MKQIIETKMVEQTTVKFVADDGKVFMGDCAEIDCQRYERRKIRENIENLYKRLHRKEVYIPLMDSTGDMHAELVTLNGDSDFYTLVDYYDYGSKDVFELESRRPSNYPCTMLVYSGEYFASVYTEDELFSLIGDLAKAIDVLNAGISEGCAKEDRTSA